MSGVNLLLRKRQQQLEAAREAKRERDEERDTARDRMSISNPSPRSDERPEGRQGVREPVYGPQRPSSPAHCTVSVQHDLQAAHAMLANVGNAFGDWDHVLTGIAKGKPLDALVEVQHRRQRRERKAKLKRRTRRGRK